MLKASVNLLLENNKNLPLFKILFNLNIRLVVYPDDNNAVQ
jgi:hypothetical protein